MYPGMLTTWEPKVTLETNVAHSVSWGLTNYIGYQQNRQTWKRKEM